jgi:hypothetical protein
MRFKEPQDDEQIRNRMLWLETHSVLKDDKEKEYARKRSDCEYSI